MKASEVLKGIEIQPHEWLDLPLYSGVTPQCVKCLKRNWAAPTLLYTSEGQEYLKRPCVLCGWRWFEHTADYKPPTGPKFKKGDRVKYAQYVYHPTDLFDETHGPARVSRHVGKRGEIVGAEKNGIYEVKLDSGESAPLYEDELIAEPVEVKSFPLWHWHGPKPGPDEEQLWDAVRGLFKVLYDDWPESMHMDEIVFSPMFNAPTQLEREAIFAVERELAHEQALKENGSKS